MNGRIVVLRAGVRPDAAIERAAARRAAMDAYAMSPLTRLAYDDLRASVLTPGQAIDYSQVTAIKMALRSRLQEQVARTTGQATLIRDLAPYDISGAAAAAAQYAQLSNVNALVANTWLAKDQGFTKLGVNQALGIFAFAQEQPAPKIKGIRFTVGASVPLAQFWLAPLYADQSSNIGYFDPPIVYGPQQSIGVDLISSAAVVAATELYTLYGFVCEIPGMTVQSDQSNLI
jgi:hypothetical protein